MSQDADPLTQNAVLVSLIEVFYVTDYKSTEHLISFFVKYCQIRFVSFKCRSDIRKRSYNVMIQLKTLVYHNSYL